MAERNPRQPVVDLIGAIAAKIADGTLPRQEFRTFWGGPGTGRQCRGCGLPIPADETEVELALLGAVRLRLHQRCFNVWQRECRRPQPEINGGSAPSPWTLFFELDVARRASWNRSAEIEWNAATAETMLEGARVRARSRAAQAKAVRLLARSRELRADTAALALATAGRAMPAQVFDASDARLPSSSPA